MMAIDDNDNGDDVDDDVDDSCPMVVRGRLKLAQPPTTSLPFLSLPRLSQYLLCWFVYFQCWLLSISEGEGLCIYDLNFECFRWRTPQALILLGMENHQSSIPVPSTPLAILVMLVCIFPMLTFEYFRRRRFVYLRFEFWVLQMNKSSGSHPSLYEKPPVFHSCPFHASL